MQEITDVTKRFKILLDKGISTPNIIELNKQSDILYEWFINCLLLPDTCSPHIYTDTVLPSSLIKKRMQTLNYYHNAPITEGGFYICKTPMYFWEFDSEGITFSPITREIDLTFEQWCSKNLFDLRIQGSIGILIKILQKMGDSK